MCRSKRAICFLLHGKLRLDNTVTTPADRVPRQKTPSSPKAVTASKRFGREQIAREVYLDLGRQWTQGLNQTDAVIAC
jgi:hypothetical protein